MLSLDQDVSVLELSMTPLDVDVLLQPVLPSLDMSFTENCAALDVSVLQQPVLPLNVSVLRAGCVALDEFYSSRCCPWMCTGALQDV